MVEILSIVIKILAVCISLLAVLLLMIAGRKRVGKAAAVRMYDYINNQLKEKKNRFVDYQKIETFLSRNGAKYFFGVNIVPVTYLGLCMICAVVLAAIGFKVFSVLAVPLAILGVYLPGMLLQKYNRSLNKKLVPDLKLIYSALAVQIRAGVYMSEALMECYLSVDNKRLKEALYKVSNEIAASMDVPKALNYLEKSFDSTYIDSLCVVLLQSIESGQATELLMDISEQIKELEEVLLNESKEKLDSKLLVFQLLIFAGIIVVMLYASLYQVVVAMSNL